MVHPNLCYNEACYKGTVYIVIVTIPGTYNRNIHLYNVSSYEHISSLKGHIGVITDIVASPCGGYCFSSSSDKSMKVKIETVETNRQTVS